MKKLKLSNLIKKEIRKKAGKSKLDESFALLGGVVSMPALGRPTVTTNSRIKLRSLVEDDWPGVTSNEPKIDKAAFFESVSNYNTLGKAIYREGNLKDIAERLAKVAAAARAHTLQETEDWFDKVSVTRNMKELHGLSGGFSKCATEAQSLQERMETLYEDMGNILNRYYNIKEINEGKKSTIKEWVTRSSLHEESYQEFFQSALDKYGVETPSKLADDKKKEFYDYIDKNWDAKEETD